MAGSDGIGRGSGSRGRGRLRAVPGPGGAGEAGAGPDDAGLAPVSSPSPSGSHSPTSESPVSPGSPRALRGRNSLALIRDLAMGEWDTTSLARIYGTSVREVEFFESAHSSEIAEVRAALSGTIDAATAGLWITRKQHRLAEYQQAIEDIDATLARLRGLGIDWSRAHRDMFRARLDLYRQAADELGAYPQRTAAPVRQGQPVRYIIDSEETQEMT